MNKNWLRSTIRNFEPYDVPEIKEKIVINANESPYNVFDFPEVKADFLARLAFTPSFRYPDPFAGELRVALAAYAGVQPDEVLVGNGGDEIISVIENTFLDPGDTLLVHAPSFDIYNIDAEVLGAKIVYVNDLPGFKRDRAGLLARVKELQPKLTVICNPNNPTGELLPLEYIEEIVQAAENPVVVDEAYMEFAGAESIIGKLAKYKNLIVIRTLSKAFGMAGLRIGYAMAQKEMIQALALVKPVYNVSSVSQIAALSVMKYRGMILEHNVPPTLAAREYLYNALKDVPGVTAYPSAANFLLVRVPDGAAAVKALSSAGICVRCYKAASLQNCLRITVTTMDVVKKVAEVIAKEAENAQC